MCRSLFSAGPSKIVALMPFDIAPGDTCCTQSWAGFEATPLKFLWLAFDPAFYCRWARGMVQGFSNDNGSIVTALNPADRGSRVTFYAAGLVP